MFKLLCKLVNLKILLSIWNESFEFNTFLGFGVVRKKSYKSKHFGGGNFLGINKLHEAYPQVSNIYNLVLGLIYMHLKYGHWQWLV